MKEKIISILCWVLSLWFFLFGMVFITDSFIAGVLWFAAGILLLPPVVKKIREHVKFPGAVRVVLVLFIVFAALIATPVSDDSGSGEVEIAPTNSPDLPDNPTANAEDKDETDEEQDTSSSQESESETEYDDVDTTENENCELRVGAFNIQVFGQSKASDQEVMDVLAKIIRNYDIVAIQEIRDSSQTALPALVSRVNRDGSEYTYIVSERLGRTTSKEQYAYIYNTRTVWLDGKPETYPEPSGTDPFHRQPYIAPFQAGDFDAVYIVIHTDPDEATEEINALDDVIEYVKDEYPDETDIILMGDLNADGSYFNENSKNSLSGYNWLISNSVDTTTGNTQYTYDRIIVTDSAFNSFTGDAGIFRFDTAYGLSYDETTAVSDHYPVYAEFSYSGTADDERNDDISYYTPPVTTTTKSTTSSTPVQESTTTSTPVNAEYYGNSNSKVFHEAGCRYVSQIDPGNLVIFHSRQEAEAAGYRACKVCNP